MYNKIHKVEHFYKRKQRLYLLTIEISRLIVEHLPEKKKSSLITLQSHLVSSVNLTVINKYRSLGSIGQSLCKSLIIICLNYNIHSINYAECKCKHSRININCTRFTEILSPHVQAGAYIFSLLKQLKFIYEQKYLKQVETAHI